MWVDESGIIAWHDGAVTELTPTTLTFYVARDSEAAMAGLDEGEAEAKRFWRRARSLATRVSPGGTRRAPVIVSTSGVGRMVGLEYVSEDFTKAPDGWHLETRPMATYLRPLRSRRDMNAVIEKMDKVGHLLDPRAFLPGVERTSVQLPGVMKISGRAYIYKSPGQLFGSCDVDEEFWRPIKRSTFYRALEAEEAAERLAAAAAAGGTSAQPAATT
jgi:hypothetical protein